MNRLKDLREEKDLKQENVSKLINKTQVAYSQYERELYNISTEHLKILSKFYKTSIDYMLYRTDNRVPYKNSNNKTNYTNRLKDLRKSLSKTQKQVALELKIPLKSYIKYENNETKLNTQLLHIFANYFNTSIDYIVYNTDSPTPYEKSKVNWKEK